MDKQNLFISNSKRQKIRLISRIVFLVILVLIFCQWFYPAFREGYWGSLHDKMNRLKIIEEPKIVLVGNSNLSFGIQSELIEEELNMPVVNMGFHGGVGNAFHENMIKGYVNESDIVVICHTSYSDDGNVENYLIALESIDDDLRLWNLVDKKEWWSLIKAIPTSINRGMQRKTGKDIDYGVYARESFNRYGDNVAIRCVGEQVIDWSEGVPVPMVNDICVNRLNELNKYIESQGATMLIAGYPIADGEYTPTKDNYEKFERELREKIDCPVISSVDDYYFSYNLFFDTYYHLTNEGAEIRTHQLIKDLQMWRETCH